MGVQPRPRDVLWGPGAPPRGEAAGPRDAVQTGRPLEAAGAPGPRDLTPGCWRHGVPTHRTPGSKGAGSGVAVPGTAMAAGPWPRWGRGVERPKETQSRMSVSKGTRW